MNSSGSTKRGVGVFLRVVIYPLKNTPTSHAVSLALLCMHAVMPLLSCISNSSKWCLPSLVSPSSCTVLLLAYITACTVVGVLSRGKHPLQQLHSVGQIFEGGPIFERLPYMYWYPFLW